MTEERKGSVTGSLAQQFCLWTETTKCTLDRCSNWAREEVNMAANSWEDACLVSEV